MFCRYWESDVDAVNKHPGCCVERIGADESDVRKPGSERVVDGVGRH